MDLYSIYINNSTYKIDYTSKNNYHIGNLYAGLQNTESNNIDELTNLGTIVLNNNSDWCTIQLSKEDNYAYKVLCNVKENTSTNDRIYYFKLKFNDELSSNTITIKQKGKNNNPIVYPFQFTFKCNKPLYTHQDKLWFVFTTDINAHNMIQSYLNKYKDKNSINDFNIQTAVWGANGGGRYSTAYWVQNNKLIKRPESAAYNDPMLWITSVDLGSKKVLTANYDWPLPEQLYVNIIYSEYDASSGNDTWVCKATSCNPEFKFNNPDVITNITVTIE